MCPKVKYNGNKLALYFDLARQWEETAQNMYKKWRLEQERNADLEKKIEQLEKSLDFAAKQIGKRRVR